jgi:hypothetical protein
MNQAAKPFVRLAIDGVDAVIHDPEGRYDADRFDRYATFEQARDAALCCLEDVLDEGDYEDERHKAELLARIDLLEAASSFEDLASHPGYLRPPAPSGPIRPNAA